METKMTLVEALMALSKAGEKRRDARIHLRDACEVVAKTIAKEMRKTDRVALENGTVYRLRRVCWYGSQGEGFPRRLLPKDEAVDVLARDGDALWNPAGNFHDGRNLHRPVGPLYDAHTAYVGNEERVYVATAEVLLAFAAEVPEVVGRLKIKFSKEAGAYTTAADEIAELQPKN